MEVDISGYMTGTFGAGAWRGDVMPNFHVTTASQFGELMSYRNPSFQLDGTVKENKIVLAGG